jgi:hypothetical protein
MHDSIFLVDSIIQITKASPETPNSVGGVDITIAGKNKSNKTIKYITFKVVPYNAVGDIVSCSIKDTKRFNGKITGPINSQETFSGYWECAWYNYTIKSIVIEQIEIEYTDGSELIIRENQIPIVSSFSKTKNNRNKK